MSHNTVNSPALNDVCIIQIDRLISKLLVKLWSSFPHATLWSLSKIQLSCALILTISKPYCSHHLQSPCFSADCPQVLLNCMELNCVLFYTWGSKPFLYSKHFPICIPPNCASCSSRRTNLVCASQIIVYKVKFGLNSKCLRLILLGLLLHTK